MFFIREGKYKKKEKKKYYFKSYSQRIKRESI